MIELRIDEKKCVSCGNCYWFEKGEFYKQGSIVVDEKKYNGEIKRLIDRCYLDLITKEEVEQ